MKERDELKTFKAAEDVKALSRPQKAEDYKLELPADFKPPAGVEFKLDTANPALGQLKQVAFKHGLSNEAANELLGVYAADQLDREARLSNGRKQEQASLGVNAGARVDAILNYLSGTDPTSDKRDAAALGEGLQTARQVEAWERLINRVTNQGSASFSQQHRVAPDTSEIPGYDNMNFAQRRFAQDQLAARRRA